MNAHLLALGVPHFTPASSASQLFLAEVNRARRVLYKCKQVRETVMTPGCEGCRRSAEMSTRSQRESGFLCRGPSFLQALLRSARLGGNSAMVLRAVLSAQADKVSQALGMRSGVEMRAARCAAERTGAQIVLGRQTPCPLSCSCADVLGRGGCLSEPCTSTTSRWRLAGEAASSCVLLADPL